MPPTLVASTLSLLKRGIVRLFRLPPASSFTSAWFSTSLIFASCRKDVGVLCAAVETRPMIPPTQAAAACTLQSSAILILLTVRFIWELPSSMPTETLAFGVSPVSQILDPRIVRSRISASLVLPNRPASSPLCRSCRSM